MRVLTGKRGSGKTTKLIMLAHNNNGYIVVQSPEEASRVYTEAKKIGCLIHFPLTYGEIYRGEYYGKGVRKLHIDNIDSFLSQMFPSLDIESGSLTIEETLNEVN